ncbi:MAG: septal ring lytic transglycosylase RlpA family protein [Terracidiphilus sp.]
MSLKTPLGACLLAGASSAALVAAVVTLASPAVQANVALPRPVATMPPAAPPIAMATPSFLVPPIIKPDHAALSWSDKLHGFASWYGGVFDGRRTASGEPFDKKALTACHPTLPFGSVVRVVNRSNKRSVIVRITDRGDLIDEGRIIDLSQAAAEKLAMTEAGLARVDLEVLSLGGHARRRN